MIINMTVGGGGAALNFDVKAYATKELLLAAAPKENTIGIITTTAITGWIIDANQPENLTEGMVWISVGTLSAVEFNALKKNGLQVYPLSAKQYISGALVNVTAMSYQGGEWITWRTYLYNKGDECTNITGGWNGVKTSGSSHTSPIFSFNDDHIHISKGSSTVSGVLATENKIDITNAETLFLDLTNNTSTYCALFVGPSNNTWTDRVIGKDCTATGIFKADVSALTGSYYVGLYIYTAETTADVSVHEVYYE